MAAFATVTVCFHTLASHSHHPFTSFWLVPPSGLPCPCICTYAVWDPWKPSPQCPSHLLREPLPPGLHAQVLSKLHFALISASITTWVRCCQRTYFSASSTLQSECTELQCVLLTCSVASIRPQQWLHRGGPEGAGVGKWRTMSRKKHGLLGLCFLYRELFKCSPESHMEEIGVYSDQCSLWWPGSITAQFISIHF